MFLSGDHSKLYLVSVISDAKRRLDNLRSHLYHLWKETTDALSSSHDVANQRKIINQLTARQRVLQCSSRLISPVPFEFSLVKT
jgi:hypothetical protein